jgi:hypothetical protein
MMIAPIARADIAVSFANSGKGLDPVVKAGHGTATIELAFSIDGTGVVSLDASTTSTHGTFAAVVAEWDKADVGSVADPALHGKTFTLIGSQSGGAGLTITKLGGGGIGIQGENSNRVDGLNYGPSDTKSTPETLTWTLKAPVGLALDFKSWSYVDGASGDLRVSNGTAARDFPNMKGPTGTLALKDLPLADGQAIRFLEIPGTGASTGAGIAGFTFAVAAPPAAGADRTFDNGAGNYLWEVAANWSPDGLPAAPGNAVIDGHEVFLGNARPGGPARLDIVEGTLTLSGSAALTAKSMTFGRGEGKRARVVLKGSHVSFRHNDSVAKDEFAVGSSGTLETHPDGDGTAPLELGEAKLVLDQGSQWILDGTQSAGPYDPGYRFILANFGSFSGSTEGISTRGFKLPPEQELKLVATQTTLYFEVVEKSADTGPN